MFRQQAHLALTVLYLGTFGSFIGFSGALPLLINVVFGKLPGGLVNTHAPKAMAYAWLGPLVGSLFRPVGGWMADQLEGRPHRPAVLRAHGPRRPGRGPVRPPGPGRPGARGVLPAVPGPVPGAVRGHRPGQRRRVPDGAPPHRARHGAAHRGLDSAVAAYGSFLVPAVFRLQVDAGTPQVALYLFAGYYVLCLVLNGWHQARRTETGVAMAVSPAPR